ncbi:hypothetical protein VNO77_27594 [Canavalia gladiata]|uniref:Uncharacterized protein n=1 Tax=Canavalia gladiata TaxID=3824 RepID=A0AAN9KUA4_CANGL
MRSSFLEQVSMTMIHLHVERILCSKYTDYLPMIDVMFDEHGYLGIQSWIHEIKLHSIMEEESLFPYDSIWVDEAEIRLIQVKETCLFDEH